METKQIDPMLAIKGKHLKKNTKKGVAKKKTTKKKEVEKKEIIIIDQMDIINSKVKIDNGIRLENIKKNKNVILTGTAPTLNITPWDKEDTDFWGCAPVITHKPAEGKRFDVLFEMHKSEYWQQADVIKRLNGYTEKHNNIMVMQDSYYQYKNSFKYPLKEIQEMANHPKLSKYFTSSIAFMIALAIYLGYERIDLYGCHMSSEEEEYSGQRSCCEAWLNYGLGKGIDYWLPDESDIMKSAYIYGYEQEKDTLLTTINVKQGFQNAVNEIEKKYEAIKEDLWQHRGAVKGADIIIKEIRKKGG